jgi:hypothetical protein
VLPDIKVTLPVGGIPRLVAFSVAVSVTGCPVRVVCVLDCRERRVPACWTVKAIAAEVLGLKLLSPS